VQERIKSVLNDEESLKEFTSAMSDFNQAFCDAMVAGVDFSIKLEVHGNVHELLHAKVDSVRFRRPKGVEKRIEQRKKRKSPLR
jgi:hypothetical protein